jgi:tRNA U38,U39,U40 pseudouridine synthase TruA
MKSLNKLINEKLILKKRKSKSISSYEDIIDILRAKDRTQAGKCAPACGLYLKDVYY